MIKKMLLLILPILLFQPTVKTAEAYEGGDILSGAIIPDTGKTVTCTIPLDIIKVPSMAELADQEIVEAIRAKDIKKVEKWLAQADTNVNAPLAKSGKTALHFAARSSSIVYGNIADVLAIINLLLDHKANLEAKDKNGNTPLFYAAYPEQAEILLRRGAAINVQNNEGNTPIMHLMTYAADDDDFAVLKKLIDYNADLSIKNKAGKTAFALINTPQLRDELRDYYHKHLKRKKESHAKVQKEIPGAGPTRLPGGVDRMIAEYVETPLAPHEEQEIAEPAAPRDFGDAREDFLPLE